MKISQVLTFLRMQKPARKTVGEYQRDLLLKQSREQFKKLIKLGKIPVVLL